MRGFAVILLFWATEKPQSVRTAAFFIVNPWIEGL